MKRGPVSNLRMAQLGITLVLVLGLFLPALAQEGTEKKPDEPDPETLEAARILLSGLTRDPPANPQKVVASLVRLGRPAVPCLMELRPAFRERVHLEVTVATLKKLDRRKVNTYLLDVVEANCGRDLEVYAWRALERDGTAAELPRLLAAMDRNKGFIKRSGEQALVAILRRESNHLAYAAINEAVQQGSMETRARIISCVADAGAPEGMAFLADLLGWRPELDLAIVTGISRMPLAEENRPVLAELRELLSSNDRNVRRAAVAALGKFKDTESIETMIALLTEDKGVAGDANWALQNVTGLKFPPDPRRWQLWYESEKEWWELEGQACLNALSSPDDEEVIRAIHLLSRRPLGREQLLAPLAALLDSDNEKVRLTAQAALNRLGFEQKRVAVARSAGYTPRAHSPAPLPAPAAGEADAKLPASPVPHTPPSSKSRPLVVIVGGLALIVLLFSLFGLVLWDWIRTLFSSLFGRQQAG